MTTQTAAVVVAAILGVVAAAYPFVAKLATKVCNGNGFSKRSGSNYSEFEKRLRAQEVQMATMSQQIADMRDDLSRLNAAIVDLCKELRTRK